MQYFKHPSAAGAHLTESRCLIKSPLHTHFLCLLTVPAAPRFLGVSQITSSNLSLEWAPPLSVPGLLKGYHVVAQLLSTDCDPSIQPTPDASLARHCVDKDFTVSVDASGSAGGGSVTLQSLAKYRNYRFKVAAVTNAGVGEYTHWIYAMTLAGSRNNTLTI